MSRAARVGGIALIVFAALYVANFLLASPLVGVEDGDNPASSLAFIRQHAGIFFSSGVASVLTAIVLTTAVLSVSDLGLRPPSSLLVRVASAFGWFAAAYFFANGVLRMQSPGTLVHMADQNRAWGEAAYLAVQMAGTQGLASAGIFALSLWSVGVSLAGWRSGTFPVALALLGFVPALPWFMGFLVRLVSLPDGAWLLYIGSMVVGIPLWGVVLGVFLVRRSARWSIGTGVGPS